MKKLLLVLLTVLVSLTLNAIDFNKTSDKSLSYVMFKSEFVNTNLNTNFEVSDRKFKIDDNVFAIIAINITLSGLTYLVAKRDNKYARKRYYYFFCNRYCIYWNVIIKKI